MTQVFFYNEPFGLESGIQLERFHLAYTILGTLNETRDNVVWIFHALTANSNAPEWWPGLVGEGKIFDPNRHFIVCVNMPGSCYGSISPLDINPAEGEGWYHHFPQFTTRDMIRCYQKLREFLGIQSIYIGIGGSMGGQQALEWGIEEPDLFKHLVLLATNAQHSAWGIAFNATQRFCIEADPTWQEAWDYAGLDGMKKARAIAMLSYRNYTSYRLAQEGWHKDVSGKVPLLSKAETYQRYQGEKLAKRFTAFSYYFLSRSMDLHDISRSRGSVNAALQKVKAATLVIGIASDILFPVSEQQTLADGIPGAQLSTIDSLYGHDGFLLEFEKIANLVNQFLITKSQVVTPTFSYS
ncbi:MAG TPA: homoserine O-acetyltransferase [Flavisolibacter sp.]|nr:homoserine O-acetyltransferase [Flavisolibacter sp.]